MDALYFQRCEFPSRSAGKSSLLIQITIVGFNQRLLRLWRGFQEYPVSWLIGESKCVSYKDNESMSGYAKYLFR